jgi:hypothetical protein
LIRVGLAAFIQPADGDDPVAQEWKGRRVRILRSWPTAFGGKIWEVGAIGTTQKAMFREQDLKADRSPKEKDVDDYRP